MTSPLKFLPPALALSLTLAACGSSSSSSSSSSQAAAAPQTSASTASSQSSALVKTASNAALGTTVLVDSHGMTLYSLSGEQAGHLICTSSACLQVWHPLPAPAGTLSAPVAGLGAVKRPDGTEQLTYKGMPLYTFTADQAPGEAKGQGLKDVGTWSAVTVGSGASSGTQSETKTAPSSGSGKYSY